MRGGRAVPRAGMAQTQSSTGSCYRRKSRRETAKPVTGAVGMGWFSNTLKHLATVKGMGGDRRGETN